MWTEEQIVGVIKSKEWALERAIVAIQARQTADEQEAEVTRHSNAVGWSASDARKGGYMARWISGGSKPRKLNGEWRAKGLALAVKYRRQLTEIANAGGAR